MKWEYKELDLNSISFIDYPHSVGRQSTMRSLGEDEWELVAIGGVNGHMAFFKRPI